MSQSITGDSFSQNKQGDSSRQQNFFPYSSYTFLTEPSAPKMSDESKIYPSFEEAVKDIKEPSPSFYRTIVPETIGPIYDHPELGTPYKPIPAPMFVDRLSEDILYTSVLECSDVGDYKSYFLPARHLCFGYSVCYPETFKVTNGIPPLSQLAFKQLDHWPQHTARSESNLPYRLHSCEFGEITGDYHYVDLSPQVYYVGSGSKHITLTVQLTNYDFYCFRQAYPHIVFPMQIDNTRRYRFKLLTDFPQLVQYGFTDSYNLWTYVLQYIHKIRFTSGFLRNIPLQKVFARRLPEILTWQCRSSVFDSLTWLTPQQLELPEKVFSKFQRILDTDKAKYGFVCFHDYTKWWKRQMKKYRKTQIKFQMGIFDMFSTSYTFEHIPSTTSKPGLYSSIRELGKLAQNVNGMKDKFDSFYGSDFIQHIIGFVEAVQQMFTDTLQDIDLILTNPANFFEYICKEIPINFSPHTPTAKDFLSILGSLFAGIYLYPDKRLIGGALILYGSWSLGALLFSLPRIQRTFSKVLFFMFILLLEATKSKQASVQLQADSSMLQNICVGGVTALALVFGASNRKFSFSSLFTYLSSNTKDLFSITRGFPSLIKTLELIITMFKDALTFMFGETAIYGSLVKCTVTDTDLQDYIVYAMSTTPEQIATFTLDLEAREKWETMCKLHNHFIQLFSTPNPPTPGHIGFSMYRTAMTKFVELKREYNKVKDSINFYRPEPFMVWVWGEPGTGKTFGRDLLVKNLYSWHTEIDCTYDCTSTGLLYVRNPADPYMSGYNGNFAVAYDDVGANRQATNPEFNEIMGMGSTNQVRLNMADLAEKGRFFSSKVIIMAANTKDVNANNLILMEKAFNRRRHIVLQVERPDKPRTELATSPKDFAKVRLTVTDPQSDQVLKVFPEKEYGDNDVVWKQFHTWLAPHYAQHVKGQNALLNAKNEELRSVMERKPHPSIVTLEPSPPTEEKPTEFEVIDDKSPILTVYNEGNLRDQVTKILNEPIKDLTSEILAIRIACHINRDIDEAYQDWKDSERSEIAETAFIELIKERLEIDIGETHLCRLLPTEFKPEPKTVQSLLDYFKQIIEEQKQKFPWVKAFAVTGVIASALGLYKLYKGEVKKDTPTLQAYDSPTLNPPSKSVIMQSYDNPTLNPPAKSVVLQSTTEDLIGLFRNNTYRAYRTAGGNNFSVHVIALQYNTFLFPYHFTVPEETDYQLCNPTKGNFFVRLSGKDFIHVGNTDWCVVNLSTLPHHKSIVNHFATEEQLLRVRVFNATLLNIVPYKNTIEFHRNNMGSATRWDQPIDQVVHGEQIYVCSGYKYKWQTINGDCGALVLSLDNTCGSKIMGMHFGYQQSSKSGFCSLIPREKILNLLEISTPPVQKIMPGDLELQYSTSDPPPVIQPEGSLPKFEYFGIVNDAPSQPLNHGPLQRSPAYGQIYPPTKDLSVLRKNDERMDEEFRGDPDILERNVLDFNIDTVSWPRQELSMATEFLQHELETFTETIPREVQTLDWAINGTWIDEARLDNTEPINLHTSSGYGLNGIKRNHFDQTDPKKMTISNPVLQKMVDDQWNDWMEGKTHPCIWTHALKSEPLKFSKIKNGATRTFCVAQTAFLLNVRRLFGSLTVSMKNTKITSFSCLGMDPRSEQWSELYSNLRDVSDIGLDMDFFKYDRTAVTSQLALAFAEAVNSWYNDSECYQRARVIVINDLIHSYCLIKQYLTRKKRGNPSGNPLTTELNNCVNLLMLCMVYLVIARKKQPTEYSLKSFKKNIRAKFFGDDVIFSINRSILEWFTATDISTVYAFYGVPVTPADKSSELSFRPLNELTFLKRSFQPFDDPRYPWQAALDKNSIFNLTQFFRLEKHQGHPIESITSNLEDSFVEAYHWGREFFETHKKKVNTWLKENGHPQIFTTFSECDLIYREKLGLIQGQSLSSKFEGQVICALKEASLRRSANSVSGVATR